MKTITHTVTTPIIYGHSLYIHHAQHALKNKSINSEEFQVATNKYANAIFLGYRMSEELANAGNKANTKIHLHVLHNDPYEMNDLFAIVLAKELSAKYYEIQPCVEKDGTFTATHEKSLLDKTHDGRREFKGTYSFNENILTISYTEE